MTRRMTSAVVFAVLMFTCSLALPAHANTIYVSTTGNDANTGTIDQPVATPGRALQLATSGDTVYLRAGTYTITQSLLVTVANLTISSYPGEHAAIVGGTSDLTNLTSILIEYASGVSILNLEVQGGSYYGIKLDNMNGPQSGIRIAGCYVHHTGRDAIKTQDADNVVIENNELAYTGVRDSTNAEGIDTIGSLGVTISGNHIHDVATNGLYIKGGTVNGVVENNLVERTGYAGILLGSETDAISMRNNAVYQCSDSIARNNIVVGARMAGLGTIAGNNVRFENNTVIDAAASAQGGFRAAVDQYGTSPGQVVFENNIIALDPASTRPLVYLYNFAGTLTSDDNIWFSPSGSYVFEVDSSSGTTYYNSLAAWQSATRADAHSRATDPRLDANNLWTPMAGSPAIDAGTTLADVPTDYAGITRPQGPGYDIGAHELAATLQDPLGAPTNLTATARSGTSIYLSWVDNAGAEDNYAIERALDGITFNTLATLPPNATSYTDTTVAGGTTYAYRVRATTSSGGASPYSNVASATTALPAPGAPSALKATAVSPTQINLSWADNSTNEDGFRIEQSTDGTSFTLLATVGANVTGYQNTHLRKGKKYYYRVASYNSGGTSAYSNIAGATTPRR